MSVHYLEASKASNEHRYSSKDSSEGKPARSGSLYNLEFHLYYSYIANYDSRTGGQSYKAAVYWVIAIKPMPR